MATSVTTFQYFHEHLAKRTIDLDSDPLRLALFPYNVNVYHIHDTFSDISAYELAAGSGYATGGELLTFTSLDEENGVVTLNASPVIWRGLTATIGIAVLYAEVTRNSVTNPLIQYYLLNAPSSNITTTGQDWAFHFPPSGVMTIEVG